MIRLLLVVVAFGFGITGSIGQGTFSKVGDSDPEAKRILDKIKKEYDGFKSISVDFDLVLSLPEQEEEIQKGYLKQKGEKFVAKIADQEIFCNGKSIWVHLISNNEVQINDFDPEESEDMLSPKDMLRIYEKGDYIYAITDEEIVKGKRLTLIEFKPTDRNSEYIKMRLAVDTKANRVYSVKVFSRDGSRYTLKVNNLKANPVLDESVFAFDKSKYPGVRVEDLRID